MLTTKTASSDTTLTYLATDTVNANDTVVENTVWTYNFSSNASPLVFYSPEIIGTQQRSANDPLWEYVDSILEKIWENSAYVSSKEDDAWLDEIRLSWHTNLEDIYDESDTGE